MKHIKLISVVLILSFIISNTLLAKDSGEPKTKSFKISQGGLLKVEIRSGDIKIQTWDKDEVLIKIEGLSDEAFKYLEMNLRGDKLTVRDESYDEETENGVKFTFTVPSKFNLDLQTMGGDISLANNITGNVSIDTYGGDINAMNINGTTEVETKGGDIRLNELNGDCTINTYGGDISISLINSKKAKVSTNGGDIDIKKSLYGVDVKTSGGNITIEELGGDSELITYGGDLSVGSAIGNLKMDTHGGNLELNSAKGNIKGKTNGGDINFKKIEGSVDLKTMSGMVSIELSPAPNSDNKISTNSGSIELILPASAKTTIEARIHIQGRWNSTKDDYEIYSDFDSQSYKTDQDTHEIIGNYKVNGGGSKIFLKSVNDEINIKKSK